MLSPINSNDGLVFAVCINWSLVSSFWNSTTLLEYYFAEVVLPQPLGPTIKTPPKVLSLLSNILSETLLLYT